MAGQGEKVTISVSGGSPWGFRLFGGEDQPLSVAKLRRKSKAQEAGLREADLLLTINGYSCRDMSHATAMTLVDTSGHTLTMTVLRGTQDKHAVDAAFQTLGPSKAVPAHILQGQSRAETFNGGGPGGAADAVVDHTEAGAASAALQTYHVNGPEDDNVRRTQQTFYDGDTTRQVTTETSQQQFGSTTVTKVRREEVSTSGGWPASPSTPHRQTHYEEKTSSYPGSVPTFSVTKFGSSTTQQSKPGVWAPSGAGGGGLSVSAPEGVHVQQNPDQSVTMTVGLGSPRQHDLASPRHRDTSPSGYQAPQSEPLEKHARHFNVSKVQVGNKPDVWAPGSDGLEAPVLRPFMVDTPSKWSPTPARKPIPPETAPKPQLKQPTQYDPAPEPQYDVPDAQPDPRPAWMQLDPAHRDSPISRIPSNPALIEPLHFSELIRGGESFSDEDEYLDSPNTFARKKKIYADSSFYDDPEARYPTIEEQIKMARKVALSLMSPANKKARGHKMFMKRLKKSSRWEAGAEHPEQVEFYLDELDDEPEEMYHVPEPWKNPGHTWHPQRQPAPAPAARPGSGVVFRNPKPKPAPPPLGEMPANVPGLYVPPPAPYQLPKEEPKPEPAFKLPQNPAYKPSIPKPFKPSMVDDVPDEGQHGIEEPPAARDSPVFKPSSEFTKEYDEDMEIPMAPPPPPPPIPTLSNWATPVGSKPGDDRESMKKKLNKEDLENVRLYGKKSMHNMVSPQVCFSLSDDLRNMKGKGGKLFAKRRARAEQWVVEDKQGLPGPNQEIRSKILNKSAQEQALNSPQTPDDSVDFSVPSGNVNRLKELITQTKSAKSPWQAAAEGDLDGAFDHLHYNTVPLRGKKGGSTSLVDLTGIDARYRSSNPAAADACPDYSTATTYSKGRPQPSSSSARPAAAPNLPSPQTQPKLPEFTRKIQPWSSSVPSSGPSSAGAVIDWSEFGEPASHVSKPASTASYKPSAPDYNRRMKPWRGSGDFDHVDVSKASGDGGAYRTVSFKTPSANFGAFTGTPSHTVSNSIPEVPATGEAPEGFSDL